MFSKCSHSIFRVFQLHDIWKRAALSRPCLHVSRVCISPPITIHLTPPFLPSFLLSDHHFLHYFSPDLFSHLANWGKNGPVHTENICSDASRISKLWGICPLNLAKRGHLKLRRGHCKKYYFLYIEVINLLKNSFLNPLLFK